MKAMIFAAGNGTRLKPLTDKTPKALLPINGKPMLEHLLLKLKAAGFDEIVINIHHFGEQIIQFLKSNNNFGLHIDISDEREYLMDTGGAIKQAACYFAEDDPILIHNVDILSNVDLGKLYQSHLMTDSLATLLVSHRSSTRQLLFDRSSCLRGWQNRETGAVKSLYPDFDPLAHTPFAFGGIHVISPKIVEWMDEWTGRFSIIDFYLSVCAKIPIRYYTTDDIDLMDIGKPETLAEADEWLDRHSVG